MYFKEIIGHTKIKEALCTSAKNNHIPHAQLFLGQEGSPNLAFALAFANYIVCENKQDKEACGTCAACRKSNKFIHPDIHFIFPVATTKKVTKDPVSSLFLSEWRAFLQENPYGNLKDWSDFLETENKQCQISKEESRTIIKDIYLKPFEASVKLFIIWLPERMHPSAANALLKILEEPPGETVFILVSNDQENLLPTILSRLQLISIPSYSIDEIQTILNTNYNIAHLQANQIAHLATGDLNYAIKLSKEIKEDHHELFRDWMRLCYSRDFSKLIEWADLFQKLAKEDQKNLFHYGLHILRMSLLLIANCSDLVKVTEEEKEFIKKFSLLLNAHKIHQLSKKINEATYHLERNSNSRILFLDLSIQLGMIIH